MACSVLVYRLFVSLRVCCKSFDATRRMHCLIGRKRRSLSLEQGTFQLVKTRYKASLEIRLSTLVHRLFAAVMEMMPCYSLPILAFLLNGGGQEPHELAVRKTSETLIGWFSKSRIN